MAIQSIPRAVLVAALCLTGVSHAFVSEGARSKHLSFVHGERTTRLQAFDMDFSAVDNFFQTQPYLSAFLACSMKASAADFVAQSSSSPQQPQQQLSNNNQPSFTFPQLNVPRNLAFLTYGGFYQGMVQTFIFSSLFPAWFGTDPTVSTVLTEVGIDLLFLGPMVCMPTVYTMKALFQGEHGTAGIEKYMYDVQNQGLLVKYWCLWAPVQTLNFAVVPPHYRVFLVAAVSFFWICLLSSISSNTTDGSEKVVPAVVPPFPLPGHQQRPISVPGNVVGTHNGRGMMAGFRSS